MIGEFFVLLCLKIIKRSKRNNLNFTKKNIEKIMADEGFEPISFGFLTTGKFLAEKEIS